MNHRLVPPRIGLLLSLPLALSIATSCAPDWHEPTASGDAGNQSSNRPQTDAGPGSGSHPGSDEDASVTGEGARTGAPDAASTLGAPVPNAPQSTQDASIGTRPSPGKSSAGNGVPDSGVTNVPADAPDDGTATPRMDAGASNIPSSQGTVCMSKEMGDGTACTTGGKAGTCSGGSCQCMRQCSGKACGDDGCGSTCGACAGGLKCSANQCVECTPTGGECASRGSADGCTVGICNSGICSTTSVNGTVCFTSSGIGQCSGGHCAVCTPNCDMKCGGASDGCGGTCTSQCDAATSTCVSQRCEPLPSGNSLYSVCTGHSCAAGLVCFALGAAGSRCYHDSAAGCQNGEMEFPLGGVCLRTCTAQGPKCPTGTNCNVSGGGWCMAGTF